MSQRHGSVLTQSFLNLPELPFLSLTEHIIEVCQHVLTKIRDDASVLLCRISIHDTEIIVQFCTITPIETSATLSLE